MKNKSNDRLLYKYLGLATQIMASLGLSVFMGSQADKWLSFKMPLLIWLLPLLVLIVLLWQIVKETSKR